MSRVVVVGMKKLFYTLLCTNITFTVFNQNLIDFFIHQKGYIFAVSLHYTHFLYSMRFEERLTALRKQHRLSQDALASKIGVHQNVIGRYERGEAKPTIEVAIKMAEALDVSIDYLVGREDVQIDKAVLEQLNTIQRLPEDERERILFTLEALLRDAKTRAAYAS